MLNVDEPAQLITVETSLRMTWRDPRLTVRVPKSSPTNYVFFRQDVTDHIWFPDVYIDGIQVSRVSSLFKLCVTIKPSFSEQQLSLKFLGLSKKEQRLQWRTVVVTLW